MIYLLKVLHLYLGCTGRILHPFFSPTKTLVPLLPNNPVVSVDTDVISVTIPFTQFFC